jgi:hypothetical protein
MSWWNAVFVAICCDPAHFAGLGCHGGMQFLSLFAVIPLTLLV